MKSKKIQPIHHEASCGPSFEDTVVKRVAAYCRVSTLAEEQEDSYDTQCEYFQNLICATPNQVLVDVYGDHGISGLSAERRPDFQRMMRDCLDGKIDIVFCKSISRFARNMADCVKSIQTLRENGISVVFEKEAINTADPSCEMLLSVLATLAQEESNNLSKHIKWADEKRNAVGTPTRRTCYGYYRIKDSSGIIHWKIEPNEARRVRLIFQRTCENKSFKQIAAELSALEKKEHVKKVWLASHAYQITKNEAYMGDLLTNKTYKPDFLSKKQRKNKGERPQYYIEGHHEGIVDKATFLRAQEVLASRRKKK